MTENRRVSFLLPNATMGQKILSSYASKLPGATALLPGTSSPGAMMLLLMDLGSGRGQYWPSMLGSWRYCSAFWVHIYCLSPTELPKMLEPVSDSKIPVSSSCMQVFLFLKEFGASGKIFFSFLPLCLSHGA